mgnify:CR=1 FL=1
MKTTFFDTYNNAWQYSHTAEIAAAAKSEKSFKELLTDLWQGVVAAITKTGDEPRIWLTHTADNKPHWNVYDPATGRRLYGATENEVMVWLEQRYNYH